MENHTVCRLTEVYEMACRIEKEAATKEYAYEEGWEWYNYERAEIQATIELTGLTYQDIEAAYAYEACTGAFEFGYIQPRYYEGLRFGSWVTTGFIQYVEMGYYEIDETLPAYQEYLKNKMERTIQLICDKFPKETAAALIGADYDFRNGIPV